MVHSLEAVDDVTGRPEKVIRALAGRLQPDTIAVVLRVGSTDAAVWLRMAVRHSLTPVAILDGDCMTRLVDHLSPASQVVRRPAGVKLDACKVKLDQRLDCLHDGEVQKCRVRQVVLSALAVV